MHSDEPIESRSVNDSGIQPIADAAGAPKSPHASTSYQRPPPPQIHRRKRSGARLRSRHRGAELRFSEPGFPRRCLPEHCRRHSGRASAQSRSRCRSQRHRHQLLSPSERRIHGARLSLGLGQAARRNRCRPGVRRGVRGRHRERRRDCGHDARFSDAIAKRRRATWRNTIPRSIWRSAPTAPTIRFSTVIAWPIPQPEPEPPVAPDSPEAPGKSDRLSAPGPGAAAAAAALPRRVGRADEPPAAHS